MSTFLNKLKQIWRLHSVWLIIGLLFGIAFVVIFGQAAVNRKIRQQYQIERVNRAALQDSIRITQDKLNQAIYNKQTFIVQKPQDLKELTADLYAELQKIKGQVQSIQKAQAVIVRDTVPLVVTNPTPNIWNFSFDTIYTEGNYEKFKGFIDTQNPSNSRRLGGELGLSLVTGLIKNKNGSADIFVKSPFPGLKITKLEGAQIDKNAFLSPVAREPLIRATATVGQNVATYNYGKGQFKLFQPEVNATVGLSVNLNKLLKKK